MLMVTMRTGYYLGQERQLIRVNGGREGLGRLLFQNSLLSAEAGTVTIYDPMRPAPVGEEASPE